VDKILGIGKVRKGDDYLHNGVLYPVEGVQRSEPGGVMITLRDFGVIILSDQLQGAVRRIMHSRPPSTHRISVGLGQTERDWLLGEASEQDCTAAEIIRRSLFLYRTVNNERKRAEERPWWRSLFSRKGRIRV